MLEQIKLDIKPLSMKILRSIRLNGRILQGYSEKTPVSELVDCLLTYAVNMGASDIHIEPQENRTKIRFRLDGRLQLIDYLPQEISPYLLTYLKLTAGLNISEKRLPQDGSILHKVKQLDIRVSVIPTLFGEKMVLRLLPSSLLTLDKMLFTQDNLRKIKNILHRSGGLITVTGPVNSGKSTLLYAMLKYLNSQEVNIVTIEDPIELAIENINQIQINEQAGLDFALALRATLRQDPDVVMIGEIRDDIVAKEAIRAALTGHLVLATVHSRSAVDVPARLLNLGVNPSVYSLVFAGAISQRLVRRICPRCRGVYRAERNSLEAMVLGKNFHEGMELHMVKAVPIAILRDIVVDWHCRKL